MSLTLKIEPHPLLEVGAFVMRTPHPLAELATPPAIARLAEPGATAPIAASEQIKTSVRDLQFEYSAPETGVYCLFDILTKNEPDQEELDFQYMILKKIGYIRRVPPPRYSSKPG